MIKVITLAAILSFGISFAYAWTAPGSNPPTGNVSAPVNVGTSDQIKNGGLGVGAFTADSAVFNGNVGIGGTPSFKLHVFDRMKLDGSQAGLWIEADVNDWFIGRNGTNGTNLRFYNTADRVTITPAGTVGIATPSPASSLKLNVNGNVGATNYCDQNGNNCIAATAIGGGGPGTGTTNYLAKWATGSTLGDSVIYDDGTNVGVGETSPGAKLHIAGNILQNNGNVLRAKNTAGTAETWMWPRFTNDATYLNYGTGGFYIRNSASSVKVFMNDTGDVGVGDGSPDGTLKLDVEGQVGATAYCDQNGANCIAATAIGSGLGSGQSYVDKTASRVFGTTYTNTTSKPIGIFITHLADLSGYCTETTYVAVLVDGIEVVNSQPTETLTVVVPVGSTYEVNRYTEWGVTSNCSFYALDNDNTRIKKWVELR